MTIPAFNPIQNSNVNVQKGPLVLKQGQVFHGSVKQLYPNQLAEIQIGEHRLVAKLETPLKVGDSHFFQVTNTSPEAQLKVVSGPVSTGSQNVQQLMDSLNLPKSQEMQQILSHFLKEQLPISREQLLQAESWLKNLPEGVSKQEALLALQKLVDLKIPFSAETFKALLFGSQTTGISKNLEQLMNLLQQNNQISPQMKLNLLNQLQSIANPFEAETAGVIISRAIQILLSSGEQSANQQQALNVLKEANILPKEATLNNWLNLSFNQISSAKNTAGQFIQQISSNTTIEQALSWIKNEPTLTNQQKNALIQMLNSLGEAKPDSQSIELLAKQLHVQLLKAYSDQGANQLFTTEKGLSAKEQLLSLLKPNITVENGQVELRNIGKQFNVSEHQFTQKLIADANAQIQSSLNSQGLVKGIQSMLESLGISYEAALNKQADIGNLTQTLKPQLLSLMQDPNTTPELKNLAETLLARFNGMQLLSNESGHQHQIIMQIPLQFLGKQVDATVQWNGRMKDDGKIDSDYARILFYLNMEALKETVIDMQVQNRIVTIHVFNEHKHLDILAEPLKAALKTGLTEKDYHLSGVIIKPFEKSITTKENVSKKSKTNDEVKPVQKGVDIRI